MAEEVREGREQNEAEGGKAQEEKREITPRREREQVRRAGPYER